MLAWNLRSSAAIDSWSKDFGRGGTGLEARSHCTASKKAAVQNLMDVHIGWTRRCVYRYSRYGSNPGTSTKNDLSLGYWVNTLCNFIVLHHFASQVRIVIFDACLTAKYTNPLSKFSYHVPILRMAKTLSLLQRHKISLNRCFWPI